MKPAEPFSKGPGLIGRVQAMLLSPALAWAVIEHEPATTRGLYVGYVAPLAAVAPACGAAGLLLFGPGIGGIGLSVTPAETLLGAAIDYAFGLVYVYFLALIVSALAPAFGGRVDRVQAMKLVAYSGTTVWLAGAFDLYPTLGFPLSILGALYSLYALYLGLPRLMGVPRDRAISLFAAVLICGAGLALGLRLATGILL